MNIYEDSDIKLNNIMMDYSPLYDYAIHPIDNTMKLDWSEKVGKPHSRTLRPVKYYLIDFGYTRNYQDDENRTPREPVGMGGDRTVPEFLTQEDCDPFAVDVYRVGNVVRQYFAQVCDNHSWLFRLY